jgi:hypothetical protein
MSLRAIDPLRVSRPEEIWSWEMGLNSLGPNALPFRRDNPSRREANQRLDGRSVRRIRSSQCVRVAAEDYLHFPLCALCQSTSIARVLQQMRSLGLRTLRFDLTVCMSGEKKVGIDFQSTQIEKLWNAFVSTELHWSLEEASSFAILESRVLQHLHIQVRVSKTSSYPHRCAFGARCKRWSWHDFVIDNSVNLVFLGMESVK